MSSAESRELGSEGGMGGGENVMAHKVEVRRVVTLFGNVVLRYQLSQQQERIDGSEAPTDGATSTPEGGSTTSHVSTQV